MRRTDIKSKNTQFWVVILLVLFLLSLTASLLLRWGRSEQTVARIYQDGVLLHEIDLLTVQEPYEFSVVSSNGGKNMIQVRRGGIRVSDADCSDHTCMSQGWLETSIAPIVCLPHKLVIQLEKNATEENFDALAG